MLLQLLRRVTEHGKDLWIPGRHSGGVRDMLGFDPGDWVKELPGIDVVDVEAAKNNEQLDPKIQEPRTCKRHPDVLLVEQPRRPGQPRAPHAAMQCFRCEEIAQMHSTLPPWRPPEGGNPAPGSHHEEVAIERIDALREQDLKRERERKKGLRRPRDWSRADWRRFVAGS